MTLDAREYVPIAAAKLNGTIVTEIIKASYEGDKVSARRTIYTGKIFQEISIEGNPIVLALKPKSYDPSSVSDSSSPGSTSTPGGWTSALSSMA